MLRIRYIQNVIQPINQSRLEQVQEIFQQNFPELAGYAGGISELLTNPFNHGYLAILLVSETAPSRVTGFSLLLHFPQINCSFLDYLAVRRNIRGSGIGSALYEATREYCQGLGSRGLYIEVQPDDPELTPEPEILSESRKRMR
ncbi:MAG: GNAT family N-acetyltransferase, partial [Sedimentisphaerales bacterium]|nr:GNAT family N-acetyltransferase [Sedimentisphaerales bacterium]